MVPALIVGAIAVASYAASALESLQFYIPGATTEQDALREQSLEAIVKPGFLDGILGQIVNLCTGELVNQTSGYALSLFEILLGLDFLVAIYVGLMAFESGPNFLSLFMNKIFKYGFWLWVIKRWPDIAASVVSSLEKVGAFAKDVPTDLMMRPSLMINIGFDLSSSFFLYMFDTTWAKLIAPGGGFILIVRVLLGLIAAVFIFIAFGLLAINIFVTTLEYYISMALMLIFIPFAVFDKTERYASQAFSLLIAAGTRMMIATTLISIIYGFFSKTAGMSGNGFSKMFVYKDHPSVLLAMMCIVFILIMTYLCCELPALASSVMTGSMNLSSDSVFKHAAAGSYLAAKGGTMLSNSAATVSGAITRGQDAARAASNAGQGKSAQIAAGLGGFMSGLGAGVVQSTFGGREEAKAVNSAASGRTTSTVECDANGNLKPSASVTYDSQGNIVSKSMNNNFAKPSGGVSTQSQGNDSSSTVSAQATANNSGSGVSIAPNNSNANANAKGNFPSFNEQYQKPPSNANNG